MPLKMRPDVPPFLRDDNGHIPMNDETADWLVIVTPEALEGVASPPDASEERLMEYADIFGKVATYRFEHGRAGGGTIWVQMEDVVEWRSATTRVPSAGRPRACRTASHSPRGAATTSSVWRSPRAFPSRRKVEHASSATI